MADIPFFGGVATSGGGSGGTTNYDMLINKPVINVSGDPVVICDLETGVYNIEGTWSITSDDVKRETLKDDLFYVSEKNDDLSKVKQLVDRRKADGFILTHYQLGNSLIQYLQMKKLPFVLIGSIDDDSVIQVDSDHSLRGDQRG